MAKGNARVSVPECLTLTRPSIKTGEMGLFNVSVVKRTRQTAVLKEGGSRASKRVGFKTEGRCERMREGHEERDELVVDEQKKELLLMEQ